MEKKITCNVENYPRTTRQSGPTRRGFMGQIHVVFARLFWTHFCGVFMFTRTLVSVPFTSCLRDTETHTLVTLRFSADSLRVSSCCSCFVNTMGRNARLIKGFASELISNRFLGSWRGIQISDASRFWTCVCSEKDEHDLNQAAVEPERRSVYQPYESQLRKPYLKAVSVVLD